MIITQANGFVAANDVLAEERIESLHRATGPLEPFRAVALDTGGTNTGATLVGAAGASDNQAFHGVFEGRNSGSVGPVQVTSTLSGRRAVPRDQVYIVIHGPVTCLMDGGGSAGDALEVSSAGRLKKSDNTAVVGSLASGTNLKGHRGYAMLLEDAADGEYKRTFVRS